MRSTGTAGPWDGTWPLASYPSASFHALQTGAASTVAPLRLWGCIFKDMLQLEGTRFQLLRSSCCHNKSHSPPSFNSVTELPDSWETPSESGRTCLRATQLVNPNLNTARLRASCRPVQASRYTVMGLQRVCTSASWRTGSISQSAAFQFRIHTCSSTLFRPQVRFYAVPSGPVHRAEEMPSFVRRSTVGQAHEPVLALFL